MAFEDSLEATAGVFGQPSTRKLSPVGCWMSEQELVDRLSAGQSAEGITLVNDRISEFPDGRSTYLGRAGEEVHVAVQWGGPVPTLVRLGATLLSNHAFDQILTPTRVDPLLSGGMALHTLRLGSQLGWLSDAEQDYDNLRARYGRVGDSLLSRLSTRGSSQAVWKRLCCEAHGLLATATNLYDTAGLDLTIHIRLPDTDQLARDDARYKKFIDFIQNTVPKNAAYSGNSASRMLLETDGDKLGYRLPVEIDRNNREASLCANWVIVGPDVTSFRADIVETLRSVSPRRQFAKGTKTGICIPIEVQTANTYASLRQTVEGMLDRLERDLVSHLDVSTLTRTYLYAFGDVSHKSLTCSPFDIAEALIAADSLAPANNPLSLSTLLQGLGGISSRKLYPWLPPSARELMRALFGSAVPLQRSEILSKADISLSSYERHRSRLDDVGLLVEGKTHQYEASVPGRWTRNGGGQLAPKTGADVQELLLSQRLLKAQIQANSLSSTQKSSPNLTRICIG
ncbi:hypothetical protein [Natronomonas amylolytica]|uniref:hypothetical protein n=1 Tax=Natronomonas amylolytica TaxID=3108498 RepID=UPI0030099DB2